MAEGGASGTDGILLGAQGARLDARLLVEPNSGSAPEIDGTPAPLGSGTDSLPSPVLAIAVLSYREPIRLRLAIRTLLEQSLSDIRIRVFDNTEDDRVESATAALLSDHRLSYSRNTNNLGSFLNSVQALAWASESAEFCALLSDHDWVDPDWAAALVDLLSNDPGAVSAFSRTMRAEEGCFPTITLPGGDSRAILAETAVGRGRQFVAQSKIGDIVFGIHRSSVVRGIPMRPILLPDVAWVAELAHHGRILRHEERRFFRFHQANKRAEIGKQGLYRRQARMLAVRRSTRPLLAHAVLSATILRSGFGASATTSPAYAATVATLLFRRYLVRRVRKLLSSAARRLRRGRRRARSVGARLLRSFRAARGGPGRGARVA